jgi:adenine-specific DNA-methyltransferase
VSRVNDLLRQLRDKEPQLAQDLEREVAALADRRAFGLNFERHVPEAVELPGRKIRKGDKVRVLPPRGELPTKAGERLWRVVGVDRPAATATLVRLDADETASAALDDLVVVAEFRDPIYPGLVSTGKVERGGDKPFHTVINAENYHALETLLFTHRGKVDCIYIDPPYNTGAKDWKYNNDYVESDDLYRHSKWLACMERRLALAKELLNPDDSVLIVTIDEKEYLGLGILLEQTFPESRIQMVTTVINPKGSPRSNAFSRVEEYIFFVATGSATPQLSTFDMTSRSEAAESRVEWVGLRRRGSNWQRAARPALFYPIFVDPSTGKLIECGDPLPAGVHRDSVPDRANLRTVWPLNSRGAESRWQMAPQNVMDLVASGHVRSSIQAKGGVTMDYLSTGQRRQIANGDITIIGRDANGAVIVEYPGFRLQVAKTVWNVPAHDATAFGTRLVSTLIDGRRFPFPKSMYAVEDALRFYVGHKSSATIVDFFAGSGTTAHAVMRLNKQDGGRRRCISVTNNEVAADEHKRLRQDGLRPGDPGWERWGICEYITKPRIRAAITGKTPDGEPIKGDYKFTDEFPMADGFEENVEFFTLTYEAPLRVASNREFAKIAPLLWLRAGSRGRRVDDISAGWDVADAYGVLADLDHTEDFLKAVAGNDDIVIAFIVTDEDRLFESVAQELPEHVEPVRLYEAYLRNFEIESGRGAL